MTLYDTLGVPKNATKDEIKKAYRRKAKSAHPDRPGGSTTQMAIINRAYDTLSDDEKRARYDSTGEDGSEGVKRTIEQQAEQSIMMAFSQLLEKGPENRDLIALLRDGIRKQQHTTTVNRKAAEAAIKKYEKKRKKVKGGPFFDTLFEQKLLQTRNAIAQMDEHLAVIALSMKMIEGYSMEVEAATPQQQFSPLFKTLNRSY